MHVADAVETRRSIRTFLDTPVPFETVRLVLDRARMAPSSCNYQPWEATVLTGEPLRALQRALLAGEPDDPQEYDFSVPSRYPRYKERFAHLGAAMYGALGIGRGDAETRRLFRERNLLSFGAPVLLLCHFPNFMGPPQWSDVGMWLQTIMLLLRDEGLDSCPQEWMGVYGRTIKRELSLSDDTLLFCGLAIGLRDPNAPANNFARDRVSLTEQVTFLGFE